MRNFIAMISLLMLMGCVETWTNSKRPEGNFENDMRTCYTEISAWPAAKAWADRLDDCVAAKGWVRK